MFVSISIPMKEERMFKKRPEAWKKYKEHVGMLLPFP
jgi:protein-S-isoprenylcysteine O-methyltransferase Ste14